MLQIRTMQVIQRVVHRQQRAKIYNLVHLFVDNILICGKIKVVKIFL